MMPGPTQVRAEAPRSDMALNGPKAHIGRIAKILVDKPHGREPGVQPPNGLFEAQLRDMVGSELD